MEVCGMNIKELKAYLESAPQHDAEEDYRESRRVLMELILALADGAPCSLSWFTCLQNPRDWAIAISIIEQYKDDSELWDDIVELAEWCEAKGTKVPRIRVD